MMFDTSFFAGQYRRHPLTDFHSWQLTNDSLTGILIETNGMLCCRHQSPAKRQRKQPTANRTAPVAGSERSAHQPRSADAEKERSTDSGDSMGDSCEPSIACLPPRLSRGLRR